MSEEKLVGMRLYMVMLGMFLTGTAGTILTKWQNSMVGENTPAYDHPDRLAKYTHPYVQSANMFIGEFLCLLVYLSKNAFYRRSQQTPPSDDHQKRVNPLLMAIPAAFDMVGSALMNLALTMIPASIYQMLRGTLIIVIAGMSILFLKRKLFRHHWTSIAVICLGLALVGLAAVIKA